LVYCGHVFIQEMETKSNAFRMYVITMSVLVVVIIAKFWFLILKHDRI